MLPLVSGLDNLNTEELLLAGLGYVIVFLALTVLYLVFSSFPKVIRLFRAAKLRKEGKECPEECENLPGDIAAAISAALYLHFNEYHDEEIEKLTIKRVSRNYSPWSSKIYSLNQLQKIKK